MTQEVSLLEQAQEAAAETHAWRQPLIDLHNPAVFEALAAEIARIAVQDPGEDSVLLVDSATASSFPDLDSARTIVDTVWVYGVVPNHWAAAPNVRGSETGNHKIAGRFVMLLSRHHSLALIGDSSAILNNYGGWTGVRSQVEQLAQWVLDTCGAAVSLPAGPADEPDRALLAMARLAAVQANLLSAPDRMERLGDNGLMSVLDIIKAISAKRRSHDILFVFVEQIARVVTVDRCSVVRIWGNDESGHVLASHEDASVDDLVIDINRYPELLRAVQRQEKVVINDVHNDPITEEFRGDLAKAGITALLVVPIVLNDENVGTLLLRAARREGGFADAEVHFCEFVAEAASNALERAHLFDVIQEANQRLEHLATTDGLTGVHNHRYFADRLQEEFVRAQRYNTALAVILFDIDNFKGINDTFGHLVGDEVLREIAVRVDATRRQNDIFARYGGEEFVVILPHSGADGAVHKAEAIREAICSEPFACLPADFQVTISVGIGLYNRDTTTTQEHLLRMADDGLYEAKRTGKNRVILRSA